MTKPLYDIPYLEKMHDVFADLKKRSIELLDIQEGDIVADVGSGTGKDAIAMARLGAEVYGIDHSPEMISRSL